MSIDFRNILRNDKVELERYNHYHYESVVDCTIEVWYSEKVGGVVAKVLW